VTAARGGAPRFLLGVLVLLGALAGCYGRTEVGRLGPGDDGGDPIPDGGPASRDGDPFEPDPLGIILRGPDRGGPDQPSRPAASSATIAIPSATR